MRIVLFIIFLSVSAFANDQCFKEASLYYNVPESILRAIAKPESRMNPYAVNIAGRSYFPDNKTDAMGLIKTNKSFDVGLMQINRWWFERFGYEYEKGFDPCWSIKMGAYVLAYEIANHGYSWDSIGRYHSKNKKLRDNYLNKIILIK